MKVISARTFTVFLFLLFGASIFSSVFAQNKPLLSEAIQSTIDANGVKAAKQKFASMSQSEREQYEVDMEGIAELTTTYLEEGNMEALTAISEISAPFIQDMVSKSMESMEQYSPEGAEQLAEQRQAEREQEARQREEDRSRQMRERIVERQGQPRNDLERFTGLYGNPEAQDSHRQLWVTVSCDGYLVSGALWGDASPWWLRSESDNVFTYKDSFNDLRMEFETDGAGNAVEMNHDLEFMPSPLKRMGSLPKDWDSCLERRQG